MHKIIFSFLLVPLCIPGILMAGEVTSPERMTLIVTPGKTEQTLADIPASASLLAHDDLEAREIRELDQAARHLPNLHVMGQGSGGRSSYVFLRGIGSTHNEPAVTFLVDDVPMSNEGLFDLDFTDVERIELLRGPQGTLYGRNALGGVLHVVSEPAGVGPPQAKVGGNVGNLGFHREYFKLQTPIKETSLHLRLAGDQEHREGYSRNLLTGKKVEWVDQFSGQMRLSWLPVGNTDGDLLVRHQYADNGGFALNPPADLMANPYEVRLNRDGVNHKNQTTTSLRINHDAPGFSLVSITAGDFWRNRVSGDADYSRADLSLVDLREHKILASQEFRVTTPKKRKDATHWLFGVYGAQDRFDRDTDLAYQPGAVAAGLIPFAFSDVVHEVNRTRNVAIFGEVTHPILPDLELTVGLRFDRTSKRNDLSRVLETNGSALAGTATTSRQTLDETNWLPKYSLLYHLTPQHTLYATMAKGYRSGGFNTYAGTSADAAFAAESLWNYEVGFKSNLQSRRLLLSGALFDVEWHNQQVQQMLPNFAPVTRNAGRSRSRGGELEVTWTPVDQTRLTFAYGYTNARFLSFQDPMLGMDYAGRRLPMAPLHTLAVGVEHRRDLGGKWRWFGRADVEGRGDVYWDPANTGKQKMEPLLHLRTGWTYDNWELALWGHNLLDQSVQIFGESSPVLGSRILYGEPRTAGVSLAATF
ncbi:MAG: TonB-dependent receptor [Magnetococcales bacterium]|nr:TonB-dependent receptor [Magnetococcales bacterium]